MMVLFSYQARFKPPKQGMGPRVGYRASLGEELPHHGTSGVGKEQRRQRDHGLLEKEPLKSC